jgi:hypothetical protein
LGLAISLWDKQFFLSEEWRMELKKKFVSDFSKKKKFAHDWKTPFNTLSNKI